MNNRMGTISICFLLFDAATNADFFISKIVYQKKRLMSIEFAKKMAFSAKRMRTEMQKYTFGGSYI
jgi:hypothetical protein